MSAEQAECVRQVITLVRRMRARQRAYFRTRDVATLRECRDLERRVDQALTALDLIERPRLFADVNEDEP